jgi:hypothetical protein
MFIPTDFPVSFFHESTTLLASPQFRPPVSFNLSQLGRDPPCKMSLKFTAFSGSLSVRLGSNK